MLFNNFTGEIYDNLFHAVITIIDDMIHYKSCRTPKMLSVSKYDRKSAEQ